MPDLSLDAIEQLAGRLLRDAGVEARAAASVARSVRLAEADGIGLVGLGYLPTYLASVRSGRVDGRAVPAVTQPRPAVVQVDAAHGFAHPAFDAGAPVLAAAARACGTASMGITRSYSPGVLGHLVEDLAMAGLVALAVTNTPANIAPWGGRVPLFGTNPMAFAVPRAGHAPLVVDQSASVVAKVVLLERAKAGAPIPEGWAFDAQGRPTTDPAAALEGSMAPFGGVKGTSIALMIELLAAGLTGAEYSKDAPPYGVTGAPPPGMGQFILALDPGAFDPLFAQRIEALFTAMLAQDGVRLPGDRRLLARARAASHGVAVDDATLAACEVAR